MILSSCTYQAYFSLFVKYILLVPKKKNIAFKIEMSKLSLAKMTTPYFVRSKPVRCMCNISIGNIVIKHSILLTLSTPMTT